MAVDSGRDQLCVGAKGNLVLSAQFFCEAKTGLKIKLIKNDKIICH